MTGELFLAAASRQALAEEELVQQKSAERKDVRKKNSPKKDSFNYSNNHLFSDHPFYLPGTVHSWDSIYIVTGMLEKLEEIFSSYYSRWYDISKRRHFGKLLCTISVLIILEYHQQ
jgi:hypothetical protein